MRNFTQVNLNFAVTDNLTALRNGKYIAEIQEEVATYMTIPKQLKPLECRLSKTRVGYVDGIPVVRDVVTGVDPIPEGEDLLLVSRQYADACRLFCLPTERLRVASGPIYVKGNSLPIACASISEVEACLYFDMPEVFNGHSTAADIYDTRLDRLTA